MNIFLIGMRGTGKTTLGRILAQRLAWRFVDMDEALTAEAGLSIAALVERYGWEAFRARERRLLTRLAADRQQVVATGGGLVLAAANITTLFKGGTVVWLRARLETIEQRLAADPRSAAFRPPLTALAQAAEIKTILTARTPLYQAAMHFAVDTDARDVETLVDEIQRHLAQHTSRQRLMPHTTS